MLNSANQHQDRSKFVLLTEPSSRYGDGATMLEPAELLQDGLCRVLVHHQFPHYAAAERNLEQRIEAMKLSLYYEGSRAVGVTIASLCGVSGWLWCVGDMRHPRAEAIAASCGVPVSVIRLSIRDDLVMYCLSADEVRWETTWPGYFGEYGLRVFGMSHDASELQNRLLGLRAKIDLGSSEAITSWLQLNEDCLNRRSLQQICQDAIICALPDGEHFDHVAMHSAKVSVEGITSVFCKVAQKQWCECTVVENSGRQYMKREFKSLFGGYES